MARLPENQSNKKLNQTTLGDLPDDITCDIISRLPAKEVSYFKTLSRKWNQTLSDSSFKKLYYERSAKNPKFFVARIIQTDEPDEKGDIIEELFLHFSLSDLKEEGTVHFENVPRKIESDAEMMYAANGGSLTCFANHEEFFIFNPTSKRFANLPEISYTTDDEVSTAGFGYIPSSNEYIFVHIFDQSKEEAEDFDLRCEWLTLSEGNQHDDIRTSLSWKVLETPCPCPAKESGVLVDGLFYFCISDQCDHTAKEVIFSIDLKTEHFKIIAHPDESLYIESNRRFVVELNGQLCFGDIFIDAAEMDVWLLTNAENREWMKLCRVELSRLFGGSFYTERWITILGLRNGELIIHGVKNDRLDYYNIQDKTSREVTVSVPRWNQACIYTQSLSFLNISSS